MVPTLPAELGGGPMTIFTRGMKWASITCETRPKALAKVLVEVQDPRGAEDVQGVWRNLLKWLSEGQGEFAQVAAELKKAEPRIIGDRLQIEMGAEGPGKLVGLGLRQTLETSGRVDCVNKLKQIALAMHNYHAVHKSFPPAFSADKDGKPLLSWRVLILPYIEQEALFKEFHLNEPWDSLHNKTLIPKMPKNYACPTSPKTNGLTTYLVPRGAGTIFPGAKGVPIKEITDGTSNTIMVMEVDDGQAKVWTKPEDWEVDPEPKLPTHHSDGTNISFADGSVRFLKGSISPKLLLKLLTKDGGEVISPADL
jgi:prepilin-type processing-associated H-X9-DG protein